MKKNKLTKAQCLLFAVSFLAVVFTAVPYVRAYMVERRATAQYESGGMRGGGPGGAGGFNPQQMAERRLKQMTEQLQLTAEQSAKIKAIQESFAPRTQAIFQDTNLSREQRREKMRPLRTESDAQIRQVLTPEQQTKFDAMQAQRRARFGNGERRGGMANGNRNRNDANATNPPAPAVNPPAPN